MTQIGFELIDQSGNSMRWDINPQGWTALPELRAGVMAHDEGLVFWNACPGAGELYFAQIRIDFGAPIVGVLPCAGWSVNGSVLTIGNGYEYLPPRASLRIRWAYPLVAPTQVHYGPALVTWSARQRRNVSGPLMLDLVHPRETGAIPVFGERRVAPPGAINRNGVAGWEQDAAGMTLRSDLTMNRTPVGILDQQTGMPIGARWQNGMPEEYTLSVGQRRPTQLAEFMVAPAGGPSSSSAQLRMTRNGSSPYAHVLRGDDRDNSFVQFDGQHRGNVLGHVRAAAQCGDSIARYDLEVLANDAIIATTDFSSLPRGGRDLAWRLDACSHSEVHWLAAQQGAAQLVLHQGANGCFLRAPFGYEFSPNPWYDYGCARDVDVDATMERWLSCYALGLFGRVDAIRRAIHGCPWPAPKFLGVGRLQTEIFPTYQGVYGPGDYFGHLALGCLAALDKSATDWRAFALLQPTPDGQVCSSLHDLRVSLVNAQLGREQSAVLLAVLEEMLA